MTQLTVDTSDDLAVIRACRNMLNELLGETQGITVLDASEWEDGTVIASRGKAAGPDGGAGDNGGDGAPDARKDPQGVVFDPEFCGEATDPFYGSGKRSGQWKRKRGVTEEAYDAWHTAQVALIAAGNTAGEDESINTAGAFGGGGGEPASDPAPEDCGAFMGWVSAKQAAGFFTQDDIGDAYSQAGVQVTDLFPPNDEATVKKNVAMLYQILVVKAGA